MVAAYLYIYIRVCGCVLVCRNGILRPKVCSCHEILPRYTAEFESANRKRRSIRDNTFRGLFVRNECLFVVLSQDRLKSWSNCLCLFVDLYRKQMNQASVAVHFHEFIRVPTWQSLEHQSMSMQFWLLRWTRHIHNTIPGKPFSPSTISKLADGACWSLPSRNQFSVTWKRYV